MRILHLIALDQRTPAAGIAAPPGAGLADEPVLACRLALEAAGHEHRVCLVGGRRGAERAAGLGLHANLVLRPPLACPALARRALRRSLAGWRPEVVHAWDRRALSLATAADPVGGFVVSGPEQGRPLAPLAPALNRTVVIRPELASELPPPDPRAVCAPPPVRVGTRESGTRLRRELGLGAGDVSILLLGAAPHADAMRMAFLLALLREGACHTVGIIPGISAQIGRAGRFQRGGLPVRFIVSERPVTQLLTAADLAVFEGGGPGPTGCWDPKPAAAWTPIARAHAAGVPAVAPRWAMAPELYPDAAVHQCLAHNATLPELARKVLPLVEDAELRRRVGGLVREHVRAADPAAGFLRGLEIAWARAAGRPEPEHRREPAGALA